MATYYIRENSEEAIVFTLQRDATGSGVPVVYNLTGLTEVRFYRYTETDVQDYLSNVTHPTRLAVLVAANGTVRLTPANTYWQPGTYRGWLEVLMSGKWYRFPDGGDAPADSVHTFIVLHKHQ